ncbi:molybdenum cofactor guanylyltransferase [Paenibacillus sp. 7124]|uniref:Probable molybdenum cofactor guanylyltransferase n=1 Tax=Paenibacillus apii TaxID=1850370 RepID=A0A6M1PFR6_9BACL|nr:molybdenum cofactor guanylyltransferase [Paenibacillus apii]NGM82237.1 molybdenum cofactor guanylyltransferase [Paenibacillus apii]
MKNNFGEGGQMKMKIAGILIAGGRSRRMGADKALLKYGGIPAIARVAAALGEVADPVTVACGEKEREDFRFLQLPQAADRFPGCGPLAGIHAGMSAAPSDWYFAAPCDLPFVSAAFMRYILDAWERSGRRVAAVPVSRSGKVQPLLGLYHKDALPKLEIALSEGKLKVMDWLAGLDVLYVPEEGFAGHLEGAPSPLLNVNTPEEYRAAAEWRV